MGRLRCGLQVFALGLGVASVAQADETGGLTNLALLRETTRTAVQEMLSAAPVPSDQLVVVRAGRSHGANWIVSDVIAAALTERGIRVAVEAPVVPVAPPVAEPETVEVPPATPPAESSEGEASGSLLEQLRAQEAADAAAELAASEAALKAARALATESVLPPDSQLLEFRIGEFGVHYVGEGRPFFLGPKRVERAVAVDLSCRLIDGNSSDVLWVGGGDAIALDRIAKSKLTLYEAPDFKATALPTASGFRYVEPVIVSGIVAGLVYLFYTNQN